MASASPRRSGGPSWPLVLVLAIGLMLVVGASLLLYVLIAGQVTVPFTDPPRVISFGQEKVEKEWEPPEGTVPVPISGRAIPAYRKLTRDDIWDVKRGNVAVVWLPEDTMSDAIIRDANKILGRVLAHEKSPGYVFTESDFMPKGTRPGVVGGIPPGMRAMRVELNKLRGLYGLNPGDRFDIVAAIALEGDPADELKRYGGVFSDRVALESKMSNLDRQATVRVIVQNGVIVSPVETVMVPVASSGVLKRGRAGGARPVQEVVLAVRPEEIAPLTEALTVGADLSIIPRSGHPEDDPDSMTPSSTPRSPFSAGDGEGGPSGMQLVETIGGKSRELIPVPEIRKPAKESGE